MQYDHRCSKPDLILQSYFLEGKNGFFLKPLIGEWQIFNKIIGHDLKIHNLK